jgi:hypothetical protein
MTPQTKHYLIIGGGLVAAVVLGIVVYKYFEAGQSASAAANDQANQDALAYLEAEQLEGSGTYEDDLGGGGITVSGSPASQQDLAQELQGLLGDFGIGTTPSSSSGSSGGSSSSSSSSGNQPTGPGPGGTVQIPASSGPVVVTPYSVGPIGGSGKVGFLDDEPGIMQFENEEAVA